jgi:hypothetical protein
VAETYNTQITNTGVDSTVFVFTVTEGHTLAAVGVEAAGVVGPASIATHGLRPPIIHATQITNTGASSDAFSFTVQEVAETHYLTVDSVAASGIIERPVVAVLSLIFQNIAGIGVIERLAVTSTHLLRGDDLVALPTIEGIVVKQEGVLNAVDVDSSGVVGDTVGIKQTHLIAVESCSAAGEVEPLLLPHQTLTIESCSAAGEVEPLLLPHQTLTIESFSAAGEVEAAAALRTHVIETTALEQHNTVEYGEVVVYSFLPDPLYGRGEVLSGVITQGRKLTSYSLDGLSTIEGVSVVQTYIPSPFAVPMVMGV